MPSQAETCVRAFLESWKRKDLEEIMSYLAPDAVYHNVPVPPLHGEKAIREVFQYFVDHFDEADLEVLRLAADGPIVFAERIDHFRLEDRKLDLPVTGVFEVRDGKIVTFRDYFDLATFVRGTGLEL